MEIVLRENLSGLQMGIGYRLTTYQGTAGLYEEEGRKEMFYLTTHSTHFIYGYMASDIR